MFVVIRMRKRHGDSNTTRVKRGQAPLRRREGHDASILQLGAFQSPKRKKLNPGLCNLPEIYGTAAVNCHCHVLFGPLKGLDLGLLDPASALQKIPSSAVHALKISGYLLALGVRILNRQRRACPEPPICKAYAAPVQYAACSAHQCYIRVFLGGERSRKTDEESARKLQTAARCEMRDARCEQLVLCTVNNSEKRPLRNGQRAPVQCGQFRVSTLDLGYLMAVMICYCIQRRQLSSKLQALTSYSFNII